MPYRIVDEGEGLYIELFGDVTLAEIRRANEEGWENPNLGRHRYQIWDHRRVERFEVRLDLVAALARMDNVAFRQTRRLMTAFIADRADIVEVLEGYLANIEEEVTEAQVFIDEPSARAWLKGD